MIWLKAVFLTALIFVQVTDEKINHEYLPVLGLDSFTTAATNMLLGDNSPAVKEQIIKQLNELHAILTLRETSQDKLISPIVSLLENTGYKIYIMFKFYLSLFF